MKKKFYKYNYKSLSIISPDKLLIRKTASALDLIKKVDPNEYKKVFLRMKIIFITNRFGFTNEFFMPERIWFVNKSFIKKNDVIWLASIIIHEAFHATQFKDNRYIAPLTKLEKPALAVQKNFLEKVESSEAVRGRSDLSIACKEKYWEKMSKDAVSFSYFRNLLFLLENQGLKIEEIKI